MNFIEAPETDFEMQSYVLKRWVKEAKKFRRTTKHGPRQCEDRDSCEWHRRRK